MDDTILNFNCPTETPKIIKVIGVGGGGGNAVTHMFKEGIQDVTFVLCNTDNQALNRSDVPVKLLLGREITQGLGAGNKPERAMMAAEESIDDLRNMRFLSPQVWVEEPERVLLLSSLVSRKIWVS